MWPFSRDQKTAAARVVRSGGIDVEWNSCYGWWEFCADGINYSLHDNPSFDPELLARLPQVTQWLTVLDAEIDAVIAGHLEGWCAWTGRKELVNVDVSWLLQKGQIDASFADDDWGDLGVNVVITGGAISDSYAGD